MWQALSTAMDKVKMKTRSTNETSLQCIKGDKFLTEQNFDDIWQV